MICLYHANCSDGIAAALAVSLAYPDEEDDKFIPVKYGDEPPWDFLHGDDVIIVDFSYKRPVLEKMAETAKSILILDHHASAERELDNINQIPNVTALFNMERSGAVMAWGYFRTRITGEPAPELFLYVQDRDLWRKELPYSDAVTMYLRSYPMTLGAWRQHLETPVEDMIWEGAGINRWFQIRCQQMVDAWSKAPTYVEIDDFVVPAINLPAFMSSGVAGVLSEGYPFAAAFFHISDGVVYSLRRRGGHVDVSKVAERYGGGGHPAAAGFKIEEPFPWISTENLRLNQQIA